MPQYASLYSCLSKATLNRLLILLTLPTISRPRNMPARVCAFCRLGLPYATTGSKRSLSVLASKKALREFPKTPARTRFAPSPTGYLHLGSLRTALYNYLFAKATGGQFVLRIEDTDQARTVSDAEKRICENLRWAGLQWDEGPEVGGPYGPYKQTERKDLYKKYAQQIVESGHAYRCFCSPERLREHAMLRTRLGLPVDYDRRCAHLDQTEVAQKMLGAKDFTIRLKSDSTDAVWEDLVYGKVGTVNKAKQIAPEQKGWDDPILVKSDGMPTYHFANVIDDHLMKITHVIRAIEWMPSTAKHLAIYKALGWEPPAFAHVGLLTDSTGAKLSKRTGGTELQAYVDRGYFPEALLNFVALLGWSHKEKSDMLPLRQMIKKFNLNFTKGNSILKESKLEFLQSQYMREYLAGGQEHIDKMAGRIADSVSGRIGGFVGFEGQTLMSISKALLKVDAQNLVTTEGFIGRNLNFYQDPVVPVPAPEVDATRVLIASTILTTLEKIPAEEWTEVSLKTAWEELVTVAALGQENAGEASPQDEAEMRSAAKSRLARYMRWALMGKAHGPPLVASMEILGKARTLARIKQSLEV